MDAVSLVLMPPPTPYLILLKNGVGSLLIPIVVIAGVAVGVLIAKDSVQPIWSGEARRDRQT